MNNCGVLAGICEIMQFFQALGLSAPFADGVVYVSVCTLELSIYICTLLWRRLRHRWVRQRGRLLCSWIGKETTGIHKKLFGCLISFLFLIISGLHSTINGHLCHLEVPACVECLLGLRLLFELAHVHLMEHYLSFVFIFWISFFFFLQQTSICKSKILSPPFFFNCNRGYVKFCKCTSPQI